MIALSCGGVTVGNSIRVAVNFLSRFRGLMFRGELSEGEGLLLLPCGSIHMCFMRMALDVVYMDAGFTVLAMQQGLKPWRLGTFVKGAKMVLELPVETIKRCGIQPGVMLDVGAPAQAGGARTIDETGDCYGIEAAG